MLVGMSISPGVSFARVVVIKEKEVAIPAHGVTDVDAEIEFFKKAHQDTIEYNRGLYEKARKNLTEEDAAIFLAHEEMLTDEYSVTEPIISAIRDQKMNAAMATEQTLQAVIGMFESMDDEYMKARAMDARDIKDILIKHILGISDVDLSNLSEDTIVVAHEITPSATAQMDLKHVVGFISEIGGPTSHSAIIARSLEIPAISMVLEATHVLEDGMKVILNGSDGFVETEIDDEKVKAYEEAKRIEAGEKAIYETFKGKETVTKDGHKLGLWANIGTPKDIDRVLEYDAEGIGLFRSEFLYMDSPTLPSEETQFEAYKEVLEKMNGKPVVIRTLDIGGDKELSSMELEKEENPFLGYRAIRICLDRKDLFRTQLRALFRASQYGNLRIMFPMISSLHELRDAKAFAEEVKEELLKEDPSYVFNVPIGMMIEVPATAVMADDFAKEADFFSIGTNDLTQYTLAVDRGNNKVSYLYSATHPAVMALIKNTVEAAHRHGIECGVCGEAGGDPAAQETLVKYGMNELSMTPSLILKSRKLISEMNFKD